MNETPHIVTRTRRSSEAPVKREFTFTEQDLRLGGLSEALRQYRLRAWESFRTLALPDIKQEAWRRTDLRNLPAEAFHLPVKDAYLDLAPVPEDLLRPLVADQHGGQIVLLPGGAQVRLDVELAAKGVIFTDLRTAELQHGELLARVLGSVVKPEEGKFASLAGALAQNGVFLYVPRGLQIEAPLHSLLWGAGVGLAHISNVVVWVEDGASVTYVHEAASPTETGGPSMHAGTVELHVGDAATLRFVELQSWGEHVWNFSHERAQVGRDGNLEWTFGAIGSHLTKNFSELDLNGQGAVGRMSGFYFTDHDQHLDHDTQQNHLAPHTTSDLLFKGALVDDSRSVWQGMIYVAPGADKTDGYQANRNLILSKGARADSIPGLEILADDVRCTHGATVGKIDKDQVFYLLSRGIPRVEAERLVVEGFFDPIMQRIPFEGVRERFQQAIHRKMQTYSG